MEKLLDKITGCMLGGAVGDALGYPVEFMSKSLIVQQYGNQGIRRFVLDHYGLAEISDDTQMSLFTANGILMGQTRGCMRGIGCPPDEYVKYAYQDWLYTQTKMGEHQTDPHTWIRDIPELNSRRAPGNTCLIALSNPERKNNSKGCGGIMRVAPMALFCASMTNQCRQPADEAMEEYACSAGGNIAAVTHHHPLGFIPAAFLNLLIYRLTCDNNICTRASFLFHLERTKEVVLKTYQEKYAEACQYMMELIDDAVTFSKDDEMEEDVAISRLGRGAVAEETLALALYCALKHLDSFENAVCASVNHSGDSDSVGAVCGNIMGAIVGAMAIPDYYKEKLELRELIESMAHDLYTGCIISQYDSIDTPAKEQWLGRYYYMEPVGLKSHPWYYADYMLGGRAAAPTVEQLLRDGEAEHFLFFWSHHSEERTPSKACLSQWFPCSFEVEGQRYNCAEQYMMAEKARIMGDEFTRRKILQSSDPKEMKALGREVENFDEARWENYKYSIVLNGNFYKFTQNDDLKRYLLSTQDAVLAEASPHDLVWGIGYAEGAPESTAPARWRGENLLGFALMQIRRHIAEVMEGKY